MLGVKNLKKHFGDVTALDDCSFSVSPGQMLGLLGPNGAGKTTAMRGVFGLIRPDGGEVQWNDRPIGPSERRSFGYMPEERGLYPKLPVHWQLTYLGRLHGMPGREAEEAASDWLDRFSLLDRADSKVTELSHGNQQRVQLIAALIHGPDLVVLDEPFAGLDPIGASFMAEVLENLAANGVAVVFSSHQLDVVEDLCREVVIMDRGRVVLEGEVRELRAASADRYVEVTGGDHSWVARVPGATIVAKTDERTRILLSHSIGLDEVSGVAAGSGVSEFTFEPPPLSEIFKRAVGR